MTLDSRIESRESSLIPAESLERIAADPELTAQLHDVIGNYCHQVRNQLSSLKLSLYFAMKAEKDPSSSQWLGLNDRYLEVEHWLDRLQLICRPIHLQVYRLRFGLLIEARRKTWEGMVRNRRGSLVVAPSDNSIEVPMELGRVEKALDDLVRWRAGEARPESTFEISWKTEGGMFVFRWMETPVSGAAKTDDETAVAFRRDVPDLSLEGLTLPMLHRVAKLHGGRLERSMKDGWGLSIFLPMESPATE